MSAAAVLITMIVSLILAFFTDEGSKIHRQGLDSSLDGTYLSRVIFSTISTILMSAYSLYYSIKLLHLMRHANLRAQKIRTKIKA